MAAEKKGLAAKKQLKISKAQQMTMLEVLGAALLVGAAVVISISLVKYISFNSRVIGEKDQAIKDYKTSLQNVTELENNVMTMSNNTDLESVARENLSGCYDNDGKKINFYEEYQSATDESDRERYLGLVRVCSALRVVPDALPSQENMEAALSSLNQLFLWADAVPDSLAPGEVVVDEAAEGDETSGGGDSASTLQELPVRMEIESDDNTVFRALSTIERSIREFDVTSLTLEWGESGALILGGQLKAYYSGGLRAIEETKTIKASNENTGNNTTGGSTE